MRRGCAATHGPETKDFTRRGFRSWRHRGSRPVRQARHVWGHDDRRVLKQAQQPGLGRELLFDSATDGVVTLIFAPVRREPPLTLALRLEGQTSIRNRQRHMADTRVQLEVEDWVRQHWMPREYGQIFRRERLRLTSGGVFDFDAVAADNTIVATVSTSGGATATGKYPTGKIMKLRSDMLFLLLTDTKRRIMVLTERDMHQLCLKESEAGRVPLSIEFTLATIPAELAARLRHAQGVASREVRPNSR